MSQSHDSLLLYVVTNLVNGKQYIGVTSRSVDVRIKQHITSKNSLLGRAIRKYGIDCFSVSEACRGDTREILDLENIYTRSFGTIVPNGYNKVAGGTWRNPSAGINTSNAKLTDGDVEYILNNLDKRNNELAKELNVTPPTIRKIRIGEAWRHMERQPDVAPLLHRPRGEEIGNSVLTEKKVRFVFENYLVPNRRLAEKLNTTPMRIANIKAGRNWKYIKQQYDLPNVAFKDGIRPIYFRGFVFPSFSEAGRCFNMTPAAIHHLLKKGECQYVYKEHSPFFPLANFEATNG